MSILLIPTASQLLDNSPLSSDVSVSLPTPSVAILPNVGPLIILTQDGGGGEEPAPGGNPENLIVLATIPEPTPVITSYTIGELGDNPVLETAVSIPNQVSRLESSPWGELGDNPLLELAASLPTSFLSSSLQGSTLDITGSIPTAGASASYLAFVLSGDLSIPTSSSSISPYVGPLELSGTIPSPSVSSSSNTNIIEVSIPTGYGAIGKNLDSSLETTGSIPSIFSSLLPSSNPLEISIEGISASLSSSISGDTLDSTLSIDGYAELEQNIDTLGTTVSIVDASLVIAPVIDALVGLLEIPAPSIEITPAEFVNITADQLELSISIPEATLAEDDGSLDHSNINVGTPPLYSVNTTVILDDITNTNLDITTYTVTVNTGTGVIISLGSAPSISITSGVIQTVVTSSNPIVSLPEITEPTTAFPIQPEAFTYSYSQANVVIDHDVLPVLVEMSNVRNNISRSTVTSKAIWKDNVLSEIEKPNTSRSVVNLLTANYKKFTTLKNNKAAKVVLPRQRF